MRTLEHRRHSRRDPAGIHLNAAGIALARRVARDLPAFSRVLTSPKPRAVETAEAMGLSVDGRLPALGEMPDDVGPAVDEMGPTGFASYVEFVERSEAMRAYAEGQADAWRRELERVPEGGAMLLISHGGIIEFGAAAAVPGLARGWGPPLGYLEGIRLDWDGARWTGGEIVRVGPARAPAARGGARAGAP